MNAIYLDHAATTPLAPELCEFMQPWQGEDFGNPSSVHRMGVLAAEAVDSARRRVARSVAGSAADVVFTSGGTEANNLAVLGFARARRGEHVLIGPTEHASVRAPAEALRDEGFEVEILRLDPRGDLDLDQLSESLRADTAVVSLMLVNSEFGSIYPVQAVSRLIRSRAPGAAFHVDAAQALGKLELSIAELGVDALSLSAHKIHGPKGVGALVLASDTEPPRPILYGGGQESGLRSGTSNVAGIVGFGHAAELAEARRAELLEHFGELRETFRAGLGRMPCLRLLEPGDRIMPGILSVLIDGPPAEVVLHHLDARGVCASAGSACQARKHEIGPAFAAIGLDATQARRVLRFSFARETTREEIERALAVLFEVTRELESVR